MKILVSYIVYVFKQELLIKEEGKDASGNPILADIGVHLTKEV